MGKKLYVGNLGYGVTDSDLTKMFEPHGTVESAQVIMDRETGRSKGFGFVEMGSQQEAQAAIAALSGKEIEGCTLDQMKPVRRPKAVVAAAVVVAATASVVAAAAAVVAAAAVARRRRRPARHQITGARQTCHTGPKR